MNSPELNQSEPRQTSFQIVAFAAIVLAILRTVFPQLLFDTTSLILFAMAAVAFLLPQLLQFLPTLKKPKISDVEFEFEKAIQRLEERVLQAEAAPAPQIPAPSTGYPPMREEHIKSYQDILASGMSNTEKILAAAILAEQMLTQAARELGVLTAGEQRSSRALARAFASHRFISEEERQAFDEFYDLRNRIVHGRASPTNKQATRVLDLLWRLVRVLA